ncbi:MAG TPA: CGNR zinc finger domain-containing protein [Candidatus Acidoferrum sp.]|nr:CGNR zinc finger domain-containing protein [Candidatus Acidoferrum sp.]
METRICAADDCKKAFTPELDWEKFCSRKCANRVRVRRYRARHRLGMSDPPPPPPDPKGPQRDDQYAEAGILLTARRRPAAAVSATNSEPRSRALAA